MQEEKCRIKAIMQAIADEVTDYYPQTYVEDMLKNLPECVLELCGDCKKKHTNKKKES